MENRYCHRILLSANPDLRTTNYRTLIFLLFNYFYRLLIRVSAGKNAKGDNFISQKKSNTLLLVFFLN